MKILLTTFLLGSILNLNPKINTDDVFYINDNKVEMTEENYNKLLQLGYTERELKYLTQKEYNDNINVIVYNTESSSFIQKTTKYVDLNESEKTISKIIEEKQFLDDLEQIDINEKSEANIPSYIDEYKKISLVASTIKDVDYGNIYFVKTNIEWINTPTIRLSDIISIMFSNCVNIKRENGIIKFDSTFICTKRTRTYYKSYFTVIQNSNTEDEIVTKVNGENEESFKYSIDEGLMVEYQLPNDYSINDSGLNYQYEYQEFYHDFSFSLSAYFIPTSTSVNSVSFWGTYAHKKNAISLIIEQINFNKEEPYFTLPYDINFLTYYDSVGTYIVLDKNTPHWPTC